MSKLFFKQMKKEFEYCAEYINIQRKLMIEKDDTIAKDLRTLHIIKAFCRNKSLTQVECGNYQDGNFKIALRNAVSFMKLYASKNDITNFVEWINTSLSEKNAYYKIVFSQNINALDI